MKNWLIPAIVLLAVGGVGLGVGWSLNEWQDGEGTPVRTEQPGAPISTVPTQVELDAERCKAALQALGQAASKPEVQGQFSSPPRELGQAVSRYCH